MKAKIFYLLGTDGSGKTTLALNLIKVMSKERKVKYLYARHKPILVLPLKMLSLILLYKKDTQFKNYFNYSQKKSKFSRRFPVLAWIYATIWLLDYTMFYLIKVRWIYLFSPIIIVDRYVADVVVIKVYVF